MSTRTATLTADEEAGLEHARVEYNAANPDAQIKSADEYFEFYNKRACQGWASKVAAPPTKAEFDAVKAQRDELLAAIADAPVLSK